MPGPPGSLSRFSGLTDVLGDADRPGGAGRSSSACSAAFLDRPDARTIVNQNPDLIVVSVGMTLGPGGRRDRPLGGLGAGVLPASVLGIALVDWGWPFWLAFAACLARRRGSAAWSTAWSRSSGRSPRSSSRWGCSRWPGARPTWSRARRRSTSARGSSGSPGRFPAWEPRRRS